MTDNLKNNLYTKKELRFNEDGKFKIVMFSDMQETLDFDERTMHGINAVLDSEKPDLVLLGGDNCNGCVVKDEDTLHKYVNILSGPMEKRKIPWAHVWGNHDHDVGIDEKLHQSFYTEHEYCLSKSADGTTGQSNFVLPILASSSDKIMFNVWGLDSGNNIKTFANEIYGEGSALSQDALLEKKITSHKTIWGFVNFDRLVWYYKSSEELEAYNGDKIESLMILHIPPWEIYNIANNREKCGTVGDADEHYSIGTFNSGLFSAVLQRKDVRAICSGHSHLNDAAGVYCNVIICTDGSIGYTAYGDNNRRGARVFEISENAPADVRTRMVYCRDL